MRIPKDAFEMMVWERLFAAHIASLGGTQKPEDMATATDVCFEEYAKRRDAMIEKFEAKSK